MPGDGAAGERRLLGEEVGLQAASGKPGEVGQELGQQGPDLVSGCVSALGCSWRGSRYAPRRGHDTSSAPSGLPSPHRPVSRRRSSDGLGSGRQAPDARLARPLLRRGCAPSTTLPPGASPSPNPNRSSSLRRGTSATPARLSAACPARAPRRRCSDRPARGSSARSAPAWPGRPWRCRRCPPCGGPSRPSPRRRWGDPSR